MNMDTQKTISVPETGQNVSEATHMTDDEKIDFIAKKILEKYRRAFEELAK